MEERELVGQWWLPDHPDRRVGGALRVEASGASRVKLTDALHLSGQIPGTGVVVPDHFATPAIVHGTAEGKYVTLISAALSGGSEHIGGDSPTIWQELKPVAVLVGIHLHNESDAVFEGIEVEIDNLTAWSSLSNISQRVENMTVDQARRMSVESLPGKDIEAQLDTDKVALFVRRELLPADTLDKTQVCVRTTVLARITRTTADVWNGFDSTTKSLQDLLTFATRYPCSIRARRLLSSREEGLGKRIEVISEGLAKTRLDHKVDQSRFLFTLDDGNLQHILQKWSDLRNRVGLGIHVLFGLDYLQEGFYENRLFNAASVAEAMHRALFPDSKGIDPARYQRIRADLEAAIADPNDLSWVKNRLPNEPGFKQRIRELAGVPDQAAVIDLLGDVDSWTKWLGNARNSLAHLNSGDFERIPTPTRFLLARITVALMHLVLLQEMGIAPEIQRRVVRNVYGGLARSLKEAVSS